MDRRDLGRSGLTVTPIGLGCWQLQQGKGVTGKMWSVLDQQTMDAIVSAALRGGISWYDTAQVYGNGASERALAGGLDHAAVDPGGVVVATKWMPFLKPARDLRRTIDARIECLAPYPVDLYQVHFPWSRSTVAAQMREMATLVRAGKVRAVGVSNFSADQMAQAGATLQAEGLPLASNQVRINLLERSIETNGVLDLARKHRVTLIAYSPLAQGILTGRYHDDPSRVRRLPYGRRSFLSPSGKYLTPEGLARSAPLIAELRAVGEAHGATPGQVALAWLVTYYGEAVVAIPGASRPEHAAEAAAAMDLRLSADQIDRIDHLSAEATRK
jgi:aryl-alcohol dehydrogenase-like predicted oxidoreductase